LIDRTGISMGRLPMRNKRTSSLIVKENLTPVAKGRGVPDAAAVATQTEVWLAHSALDGLLW
jgi:hypothetical protein